MVTVELKFDTGVIFIAGGKYEQWVEELFDHWRSVSTNEISSPDVDNVLKEGDAETEKTFPKKVVDPLLNDVERLWEEHNSLKTAFTTLESSINNISNELQELAKMFGSFKEESEKGCKAREIKSDGKMQIFIETASEHCAQNTSKCKSDLMKEIEKVRKQNIQQEARFQSITDQLKNQINGTSSNISTNDPTLKWTQIETIRKDCSSRHNNADDEISGLKDKMTTAMSKIDSKEPNSDHYDTINRIDSTVQFLNSKVDKSYRRT